MDIVKRLQSISDLVTDLALELEELAVELGLEVVEVASYNQAEEVTGDGTATNTSQQA